MRKIERTKGRACKTIMAANKHLAVDRAGLVGVLALRTRGAGLVDVPIEYERLRTY